MKTAAKTDTKTSLERLDLPHFEPGGIVYADELNALVDALRDIRKRISVLENINEKNNPRQKSRV